MKKFQRFILSAVAAFALTMATADVAFAVTFNPAPEAYSIMPCVTLTPATAGNQIRWTRDSKTEPHMAVSGCVMLITTGDLCAAEYDSSGKKVGGVECKYFHVHGKAKVAKTVVLPAAPQPPVYVQKFAPAADGKSSYQVLEGYSCNPGTPGAGGKPTLECKPTMIDIIGEHVGLSKQVNDLQEDYSAFKAKGFPVEYALIEGEVKLVQSKEMCSNWEVDKSTGAKTCTKTEKEYELLTTESDMEGYVAGQFAAREGKGKVSPGITVTRFGVGIGLGLGGETPVGKGNAQLEWGGSFGLGPTRGLELGLHFGPQWSVGDWLDLGLEGIAYGEIGGEGKLNFASIGGGVSGDIHVSDSWSMFLRAGPTAEMKAKESGELDSRLGGIGQLGFNLTW